MEVTLSEMVIDVKLLQSLTNFAGMRCTFSPILTVVSEVPKVLKEGKSAQFVALKLSVVKLLQPINALSPIAETPVPTVSEVNLLQLHIR